MVPARMLASAERFLWGDLGDSFDDGDMVRKDNSGGAARKVTVPEGKSDRKLAMVKRTRSRSDDEPVVGKRSSREDRVLSEPASKGFSGSPKGGGATPSTETV